MIVGMTEPTPTGALACPFVAFEDDRDARADVPDHRHRCYAEIRPAPRAIAHQEAFCLSPGFAACPTFQDWARREAARAKPTIDRNELAGLARPGRGQEPASPDDDRSEERPDAGFAASAGGFAVPPTARSRSRDWAAPPAWAAGQDEGPDDAEAPPFLASASGSGGGTSAGGASDPGGTAGYARGRQAADPAAEAAAGLAGSRWLNEARSAPDDDPELADLDRSVEADRSARLGRDGGAGRGGPADDEYGDEPVGPVASAVASPGRRANQVSRRAPSAGAGRPDWERSRRNEAYPTLKTRVGMPTIPRWVLALGALVIAAVVIFSLPFLLNLGGASGIPTPSQSVAPSDAGQSSSGPSASTPVVPSQKVYTVVSGDTITKIAKRFGLSTTQLLAANPQIKNANNIKPGDKITIPSAAPSNEITGASPGAS